MKSRAHSLAIASAVIAGTTGAAIAGTATDTNRNAIVYKITNTAQRDVKLISGRAHNNRTSLKWPFRGKNKAQRARLNSAFSSI